MFGSNLTSQTGKATCTMRDYLTNGRPSHCEIIYTFITGSNNSLPSKLITNLTHNSTLSKMAIYESSDVINLGIKENMNEGKSPSWFYFAATIIRDVIGYVAKADLDTFISIPQLLNFTRHKLLNLQNWSNLAIHGGLILDFAACGGYSHCNPIQNWFYMSGQFYFISSSIVKNTHSWEKEINSGFEDLDFGLNIWNTEQVIVAYIFNEDCFWIHRLNDEASWNTAFV
jgi:hypothetical protein